MKTNLLGNSKGQSIVELTLMTPLLLIALYVPVDFGIAFYTGHLTQNAVREGARIGATLNPFDSNDVQAEVIGRLPARLQGASVTATLSGASGAACMRTVTVAASGNYNYFLYQLIGLLGFSANNSAPITRVTEMRYELQPVTYSNPC